MNQLNKYKLKKKLKEAGKLSWDILVIYSKLMIFAFLLITAFTFWVNTATELFLEYGVDLLKPIKIMLLSVIIYTILIFIDLLIKTFKLK